MITVPEPAATDWTFPRSAAGVGVLVGYGTARGVPASRLLAGTGLGVADLSARQQVTAAQELRVVRTLHHLFGEVGARVGERYTFATLGALGYAITASRTVAEAAETTLRYLDLSYSFAVPRVEIDADEVRFRIDGSGVPRDVRRFLTERDATAIWTMLEQLVPGGVGSRLDLGREEALIRFAPAELARPLARGNAAATESAARICAEIVAPRRERTGLAADVRVIITQQLADGAPLDGVAATLAMSPRTLRRRLAAEGVGYRALLDEVRSSLAEALSGAARTMPVADVASRLGYGSASAFLHARARWTKGQPSVAAPSRSKGTPFTGR